MAAADAKPESTAAAPSGAPDAKPRSQATATALISAPQLAYVFDYSFALPADQIERTWDRDQQACIDAGPTVCQLVGANLDRASEGVASARLEVQATAPWIAKFRSGAEAEAKAAGGRVEDVVSMTVYVTSRTAYLAARPELGEVWRRHAGRHFPAMTLVEVTGLVVEGAVVELQALAVLP